MLTASNRLVLFANARRSAAGSVVAVAGLAVTCLTPMLQAQEWATPVNGNWNDSSLWTPSTIPNGAGANVTIATPGTYTVNFNGSFTVGSLTIAQGAGNLAIANSSILYSGGTLLNNGTITVNPTSGPNGTYMLSNGNAILSGSGSIVLNASSNLETAVLSYNSNGGFGFTQNASHTLRGTGRVYCPFTNNGTINADQDAKILELFSQPKTNNALMTATNGGILLFSSAAHTQGPSGQIVANGGAVRFGATSLTGGAVSSVGDSACSVVGNTTFAGVSSTGALTIDNNASLHVPPAGHTNNGTITVNTTAGLNASSLVADAANVPLNGSGSVLLNASPNLETAVLTFNGIGNYGFVNAASHTIRGSGRIHCPITNDGTVNADQGGKILDLANQPKTNNALMTATNGGILNFSTGAYSQGPSGQIIANGGTVRFNAVGLTGGVVGSQGSGACVVVGSSTFANVTSTGVVTVDNNAFLHVTPAGHTNNGTITVNTPAGLNGTSIVADAVGVPLNGSGSVFLNASPNLETAVLTFNGIGNYGFVNTASHTIRGSGRIHCPITNNGTVNADQSGKILELTNQPKTNNALMTATNGGILNFQSAAYSQGSSGQIIANGGTVKFNAIGLTGGVVGSQGGTACVVTGLTTFTGVTSTGLLTLDNTASLHITPAGHTNNGTIVVNTTAGVNATSIVADAVDVPLNGSGSVVLNASPSNPDTASLTFNTVGSYGFVQGPNHAIRGSGRLYARILNNGLIAPGLETGQFGVINNSTVFTCGPTSRMEFKIAGTTGAQHDRITGASSIALNGDLRLVRTNGFIGAIGDAFDIINGPAVSGRFTTATLPRGWAVQMSPTRVRILNAGCIADVDDGFGSGIPDASVSIDDLLYYLALFEAGDVGADVDDGLFSGNQDGSVGIDDLLYYILRFEGGC